MMENQNRLKGLREEAGLTTAEVATLTGRSTSQTVHRWETGTTPLPVDVLMRLADLLSERLARPVSTDEILGRDREGTAA